MPNRANQSRRSALKFGLTGAVMLVAGGWTAARITDGTPAALIDASNHLSPAGQQMMSRVMQAILGDMLPADTTARSVLLTQSLTAMDHAISLLPPAAQKELADLLKMLAFAPTRLALTGRWSGWDSATQTDVLSLLQGLRDSRIGLKRFAYVTLHDLTTASFYGLPQAWSFMGYDGPLIAEPLSDV